MDCAFISGNINDKKILFAQISLMKISDFISKSNFKTEYKRK